MRWRKMGVVYKPEGTSWWAKSHAMAPNPVLLDGGIIRVYITSLDERGVGRPGYVDVDAGKPSTVLYVSSNPLMDAGDRGTFDENGVLPTCVLPLPDGRLYMYYAGFELCTNIRYRILTGLAVSKDGGKTFVRLKKTPILERSSSELYFRGGPFAIIENGAFRLWYVAGSEWTMVGDKELPVYSLKYMESDNGIDWADSGRTAIELTDPDEHGFGRPYVFRQDGLYRMFYSIRRLSLGAYRLGYAVSRDGLSWERRDSELGLDVSPKGWDSMAVSYSAVIQIKDRVYMFYNGNNFGETGFGYAVLESWD